VGALFYLVLNMSITAGLIGLVVALLRLVLGRRLTAPARYALWGPVLLRLALPFSAPSPVSFYNLMGLYVLPVVSVPADSAGALTMTNAVRAADAYFPLHYKSEALARLFDAAGWVWLAGALLMAAAAALLYALAAARLHKALPAQDDGLLAACAAQAGIRRKVGIYSSEYVSSPAVFGVFRPRIVIPSTMGSGGEALRFALLHECAHIRRGDNTLRVVSVIILCIHWFNPLLWLFFLLAGRDMELACDARALKRLTGPERRGYALALASLASGWQPVLAAAFGHSAVRRRIIAITRYRRLSLAGAVLTILFVLAVAVVLLANPAA
jgi:beta-lactamase regulating signal transducer with metallopeptidase domain